MASSDIEDIQEYIPSVRSIQIRAVASGGIPTEEMNSVLTAVDAASKEYGIPFISPQSFHSKCVIHSPLISKNVPGALGRVLILSLDGVGVDWTTNDDRLLPFQLSIGEKLDENLYSLDLEPHNKIKDPILVVLRPNFQVPKGTQIRTILTSCIEESLIEHNLRFPLSSHHGKGDKNKDSNTFPASHIEIDGAMIKMRGSSQSYWDTSSIFVFDNLIEEDLRRKLLAIVLKTDEGTDGTKWDDINHGPDPKIWVRGGIVDTIGQEQNTEIDPKSSTSDCWGLRDEVIYDLCFNDHPALIEFEEKLSRMFPDFIVSRLPEPVLGASVSPLTANAPTAGDSFTYHIDADPNLAPPSAWTDIFGRYPNRYPGKPRFMSCLLYLNDYWNSKKFGAPTRFLDPPTGEVYEVLPQPCRCVLMDQDITHSVVAPNLAAGKRPRYSLVWKLVFHPKKEMQNMELFPSSTPIYVGSASKFYDKKINS